MFSLFQAVQEAKFGTRRNFDSSARYFHTANVHRALQPTNATAVTMLMEEESKIALYEL
jgi:hypothetical protein